MLQVWPPHSQYQEKLYTNMLTQYKIQRSKVVELSKSISALDALFFDICGFEDRAPAVASYYDFLVRLDENHKFYLDRKRKAKRFVHKPGKKLKAGQKQHPKHAGSVKKLVKKQLKGSFCPERNNKRVSCIIHQIEQ